MRRSVVFATAAVLLLGGAASSAQGPAVFKVPFAFQSGSLKAAAGAYSVAGVKDGQVTLKQEASGKEYVVSFSQKLAPAEGLPAGPRLVFDEVGDFAPSYTEYVTVYILSEVWPTASEGYLIHTTKGSHKTKVVMAETVK
jgi:hypothetical protein